MKKVAILGGGESGTGAAILAKSQDYDIWLSDSKPIKPKYKAILEAHNIPFEENNHDLNHILDAEIVIKSPGIPLSTAIIQKIAHHNIELVSDIEFGYRHLKKENKIIAITGTNGKTTTSLLTYSILKGEVDVGLCGNIGNSFCRMLAEDPHEWYVLEVSSFQLDNIVYFKPYIAILLNISNNHLDRYNYSIEEYAASKFKITANQTIEDYFIYCMDCPILTEEMRKHPIKAQKLGFALEFQEGAVAWIEDQSITIIDMTSKKAKVSPKTSIPKNDLALQGKHNLYNAMASGITGKLLEIRKTKVRDAMAEFQNVEHRLEKVAYFNEIEFINDSKATTVHAAFYALDSINVPIIWILGGVDKGNDYGMVLEQVRNKVKAIVILGKDTKKIEESFSGIVPAIHYSESMDEAVYNAYKCAKPQYVILLSPACASFDLFEDYQARGLAFKKAVEQLIQNEASVTA